MKLLFLTQVLDEDDAVLGFVPRWIEGLARNCERVRVVALETGRLDHLPANTDVRVVGRKGTLLRWLRYRAFLKEALANDGFDAVLAHMVPRYALLARGPARRHGVPTFLWYTHAGVDRRLLAAVESVEKVFTASFESLRVDTEKRVVTGHGIDLGHFADRVEENGGPPRILSVGRLTPSKDPLTVLGAVAELVRRGRDVRLDLVGGGLTVKDETYAREVAGRIAELGLAERVERPGEVPYREIPAWYRRASVVVNASTTGSIDKVVLEAWASRRVVLSCNAAVPPLCRELGEDARWMQFETGDVRGLADGIERVLELSAERAGVLGERLRGIVARDHEVDALMARLVRQMGGEA